MTERGCEEVSLGVEMFYVLMREVVAWMDTYVKDSLSYTFKICAFCWKLCSNKKKNKEENQSRDLTISH